MSLFHSQTFKLSSMIVLVMAYFLVELIVGYMLNSIALVADAFHMLSDFLALIIGVMAHRIGKWPRSNQNTFGWQRAEVVGSQVNTVMLATLTFTIFIDCIKRFADPVGIKNPKLLLYVGAGGLAINMIGLLMLRGGHGHSHGGHGHSHGGHGHSHSGNAVADISLNDNFKEADKSVAGTVVVVQDSPTTHGHSHGKASSAQRSAATMNTKAVFLHVLSDFFGSVAVVISALVLWLVPNSTNTPNGDPWKHYVDPTISLVMVILILIPTIPLLKKSTLILLQSVPEDVIIQELKDKIDKIDGIDHVHDLHVWLLQSDVIIGTVHIGCSHANFIEASKKVKKLFHDYNIHCTTIQTEFPMNNRDPIHNTQEGDDLCVLFCDDVYNLSDSKRCNAKQLCCPKKKTSIIDIVIKGNDNHQPTTQTNAVSPYQSAC